MSIEISPKYTFSIRFKAIVIAVGVNISIFLTLTILNISSHSSIPKPIETSRIVTFREESLQQEEKPSISEIHFSEPETLTIDLDKPLPKPVEIDPVPIEIAMPNVAQCALPVLKIKSQAKNAGSESKKTEKSISISQKPENYIDQPPRELANPQPQYPKDALRRGIEGYVQVRLLINEQGLVEDIQVIQVEGWASFREAVLSTVRKWTFQPALCQGNPIKVWALKRIRFELEK